MEDIIIVAVILIAATVGIFSAVRHFRGQGGCCGGGSYKPKKKKLKNILFRKVFIVDGMHCSHCKNRVEEVVNDLDGLSGNVNLKKGELIVSYSKNISDETLISRIEKAGYTVSAIKDYN